ncbi:uncharacterized protein TNCV_4031921 [Trichonephila clavipes]|nr:uncharacterized protein TNCV_4031921 [Trichonephila clavipes]
MNKKETTTQRKRHLEKANLKRQEKIANESDVHKRQRLEKISLAVAKNRENESIIPFLKIVKFDGLFGQYGFRGQAVLFAQDLFEDTEKLSHMLPRSVDNCGIMIVTENLNITCEFSVSRDVFEALTWLVANNPLYKDVLIDNNANLSTDDLILVSENACSTSQTIVQSAVQNNQDFVQILMTFLVFYKHHGIKEMLKFLHRAILASEPALGVGKPGLCPGRQP